MDTAALWLQASWLHGNKLGTKILSVCLLFMNPLVFNVPLRGFPLKLDNGTLAQKNIIMVLHGREKSLMMISLTVWIQYTYVTDGETDRHRPTASTALMRSVVW